MADLIDRKKIKAKFEPWLKVKGYSEGELNMLKAVLYEITIMPSAQPDVTDTNVGDMISRQAAIKAFKNFLTIHDSCGVEYLCSAVTMDGVNKILSDLPSADVVEVVRCKDCVWRDGIICRNNDTMPWSDNDFCSNAERRQDG